MDVILQLFLLAVVMLAVSQLFNLAFRLKGEELVKFKEKLEYFRGKAAGIQSGTTPPSAMSEFQTELMAFMKVIFKKQLVPLILRSVVFILVFVFVGLFYKEYSSGLLPFNLLFFGSGWFAVYFLWSLILGLGLWGIKKLYKKAAGKEKAPTGVNAITRELSRISRSLLGQTRTSTGFGGSFVQAPRTAPEPAWKARLREGRKERGDEYPEEGN
ncbi:MAG: hypothetical protein ACTSU5_00895 [Promethearchaeota archaeon]